MKGYRRITWETPWSFFEGDEDMIGRLSRQLRMKLFLAGLVIGVVFAAGMAWYFSYYTRTPDYAIRMIQESIEKHDTVKFQKYVDVDSLLGDSCDALMEGLMDSERPMPEEAKAAVSGFAKMFKAPLVTSFKGTINHYVESGSWGEDASKAFDQGIPIDSDKILNKSGIREMSFRSIDYIAVDKEAGTAVVGVRVFQKEAEAEFVMEIHMARSDEGVWRVKTIGNFRDFIIFVNKARYSHLQDYMEATDALMVRHDKSVRVIEKKMQDKLLSGNLGNAELRDSLKHIMLDEYRADWSDRQDELNLIEVPDSASTLHKLRLRICSLRIDYAEKYAAWMDDKNAATIKAANEKLKEAKTLEHEAVIITSRIKESTK
jgi:hypothetical protein